MYLNVKCILTFLVVLTPKISLTHRNNDICNIYLGRNLKNFGSRYPTFPYISISIV